MARPNAHPRTAFSCEKAPATGSRGMAATNRPLASAAAVEMLAAGGNAVDAEAPRVFTQGHAVEIERGFPDLKEGRLKGAACWRADGTAMGIGGGTACEGVGFWPDPRLHTD